MKVRLKKGVKPFLFPKFGKIWKIPEDRIPKKVYDRIKHKVVEFKKKKKTKKAVKNG